MTPIEAVARAICYSDHPCNSIVGEIMEKPSYVDGREGDAHAITNAGVYRERAKAAITTLAENVTVRMANEFWAKAKGPLSDATTINSLRAAIFAALEEGK